jgi:proteasome assembly chaperone (PAC2) family protein
MGHVAISAGYYLMAKLGMHLMGEVTSPDLFDIDHIDVKDGILRIGRLPRSRFFAWKDPLEKHDLVLFIGEAQPPLGKHTFCRGLIEQAVKLGVERVFTFAAMATQMHPSHGSRVFVAATDAETLGELKRLELEVIEDGQISGLNGVLLGVAAERQIKGACLLGEIPHIFAQLPFPRASISVLEAFTTIAGISLDMTELAQQAREMDERLGVLLAQVEQTMESQPSQSEEEFASSELPEEETLSPEARQRVEALFEKAKRDRAVAYELKRELDRLGAYREYEDRFLDLFKKND